jgi:hypothetical protein
MPGRSSLVRHQIHHLALAEPGRRPLRTQHPWHRPRLHLLQVVRQALQVPQAFCLPARRVPPPDGRVQPRPLGDDARQLLVVLAARGAAAAWEDARVGSEEMAVQGVVAILSQPAFS